MNALHDYPLILIVNSIPSSTYDSIKIDSTYASSCTLNSIGSLDCWGELSVDYYDTVTVGPSRSYLDFSVAFGAYCAVKDAGNIEYWGNALTSPTQGSFKKVAISMIHECAIKELRADMLGENTQTHLNMPTTLP